MNQSDLIDKLTDRFTGLVREDIRASVVEILSAISESLASGHRCEVRGFGTFCLRTRPARSGRNPKTGEPVAVPAKAAPAFKAGKALREGIISSVKSDSLTK